MKSFAIPTVAAAVLLVASLSYGQTSTAVAPGGNPEYPSAGSPLNVPTPQEQNAATGEITQNVTGAASGAKEIVTALSEVAGAATETRGSAQTVLATSEAVERAADDLRVEVEGFLEKVAV